MQTFELDIFDYKVGTVSGGAAEKQRRKKQFFIAIFIMRSS
ncbi:hypothetical protein PCI56_21520 [Plesiomonas shigelloides subsp. oncorhynchi]|nr:hypothetical protein [Plesiomonas shigelloides]